MSRDIRSASVTGSYKNHYSEYLGQYHNLQQRTNWHIRMASGAEEQGSLDNSAKTHADILKAEILQKGENMSGVNVSRRQGNNKVTIIMELQKEHDPRIDAAVKILKKSLSRCNDTGYVEISYSLPTGSMKESTPSP